MKHVTTYNPYLTEKSELALGFSISFFSLRIIRAYLIKNNITGILTDPISSSNALIMAHSPDLSIEK
jgi:hypothetical protein